MKKPNNFVHIFDNENIELTNIERTNNNKENKFFIIKDNNIIIKFLLIIIIILSVYFNIIIFIKYKKKNSEINKLIEKITNLKHIYQIQNEINIENDDDNNIKNKNKNTIINNNKVLINKPFLPIESEDIPIKNYSKTKYNKTNIRYHFDEIYSNRTLFKINYSYLPYTNVIKSISYDKNANILFSLTGMLNLTLLDFYYHNIDIDKTKFNHIHISMGFDENYVLLSSIAIASLLNNSDSETFIHLHLILTNCSYENIKPIINLKKINKNVEFILYNGKQAEYDFGRRADGERRGVGDYTRILVPEIVNNTNRILILDSGDILVNKDLSELYFFDIGDNYFAFSLDEYAGTSLNDIPIAHNFFYPNTGVCLINVRKFREDNLYKPCFYAAMSYNSLPCPYQDIFMLVSNYKFKFWALNYNSPQFFANKNEMNSDNGYVGGIEGWFKNQKSPYKYSKEELREAALNPVITHLYHTKPYKNEANKMNQERWRKFANMTGLYEKIKEKYPRGFS